MVGPSCVIQQFNTHAPAYLHQHNHLSLTPHSRGKVTPMNCNSWISRGVSEDLKINKIKEEFNDCNDLSEMSKEMEKVTKMLLEHIMDS